MIYSFMSRKPIQKFQIQRIVVLKSEGASISDIEKDTGLGRATIQKYIDKYKSDIEAPSDFKTTILWI